MVESADQPTQGALAHRILDHAGRGLGLLHEVGEGQDRVAGDNALGVVAPQGDLAAGLAADHPRVRHAARQAFAQEVRHQLAHATAIGRVGEIADLLGTEVGLRRDRARQLGTLVAGPVEVGEEVARGREGGIVGGRAEPVHRLRRQGAGLALPGQLVGRLAHLIRERRDHGPVGALAHVRHPGEHGGGRRKQGIGEQRRREQRHPPNGVVADPVGQRFPSGAPRRLPAGHHPI
jgi:hypothetical protein